MYAVIQSGGKQYRVSPGDLLRVEKLDGEVGDKITFENVLLVGGEDESRVGQPVVLGASVIGTIVDQTRGDKIVVFKFKRRKMYRRKTGHRQYLTAVRIEEIKAADDAPKKEARSSQEEVVPEKKARSKKTADAVSRKEAVPAKKARSKKTPDAVSQKEAAPAKKARSKKTPDAESRKEAAPAKKARSKKTADAVSHKEVVPEGDQPAENQE